MRNMLLSLAGGLFLVSAPVWAHHSLSQYDREHPVTLKGTVAEYNFVNPHVQVYLDVKDETGNVEKWEIESGPPARLYRAGWNLLSLKPGDQITVTGAPSKDGHRSVSVQKLVAPDGKVLTQGAE